MAIKLTNYNDELYDDEIKKIKAQGDTQISQINEQTDKQIEKATESANKNILSADNSYDAQINKNEVQRILNERAIRKSMADNGMTNSGLNRTQQTAITLAKQNANNEVDMNRYRFVNSIRKQLAEATSELNLQRTSEINEVNNNTTDQINAVENERNSAKVSKQEEIINNIVSLTDPTSAAAYIKSVSAQYGLNANELVKYSPVIKLGGYNKYLKNKNYFNNKSDFSEIKTTLSGIDTTTSSGQTVAAKQIKNYISSHPKTTKSKIKQLLSVAGLSFSEYNAFLKDGQYFTKKASATATSKSSSKNSSGSTEDLNELVGTDTETEIDLSSVKDYSSAMKYIKDNGGKSVGVMTAREFSRNYPSIEGKYDSYIDYLKTRVLEALKD